MCYVGQVEAWPANPVELIIKRLGRLERKAAGKGRGCSVADFGCGDAAIARSPLLSGTVVHSFDVVARNDWVTVMRHNIAGIWVAFFSRCQR